MSRPLLVYSYCVLMVTDTQHPNVAQDPVDECFDLKSVVQVQVPGDNNPPRPRWVLRKNVVLFDSGEN